MLPTTIAKTSRSKHKDPTLNRVYKMKNKPFPYKESRNKRLFNIHLNLSSVKIMKIPKILHSTYIKYSGIIASIGSTIG